MVRQRHVRIITGDWFAAAAAFLGEEIAETFGAERLLVARRELLAGKHLVAVGTRETLAVPRRVLVRYPTFVDHLSIIGTRVRMHTLSYVLTVRMHDAEKRNEVLLNSRNENHVLFVYTEIIIRHCVIYLTCVKGDQLKSNKKN